MMATYIDWFRMPDGKFTALAIHFDAATRRMDGRQVKAKVTRTEWFREA
jgi:hypothetical protein